LKDLSNKGEETHCILLYRRRAEPHKNEKAYYKESKRHSEESCTSRVGETVLEARSQCLQSVRRVWQRVKGSWCGDCWGSESVIQKAEVTSKWQNSKGPLALAK